MIALLLMAQTDMTLRAPVPLDPRTVDAAPTDAARALSMVGIDRPARGPVTVVLQCVVWPSGTVVDCIPADDGGTSDFKEFRRRVDALSKGPVAQPLRAALARIPFYRINMIQASWTSLVTVLISEVISPADIPPATVGRADHAGGELRVDQDRNTEISYLYPWGPLRAGVEGRMKATCRVLADRSLYCRDAYVDPLPGKGIASAILPPEFDVDFRKATLRAFATMHAQSRTTAGYDSVGSEGLITLEWRLPGK